MTRYTRALISVADKAGVEDLANSLINMGIEILSTGGTAATLRQAGFEVTDVSQVTGFPEIMDGRVKTLHPMIHGGLLGRRDVDNQTMTEHRIRHLPLMVDERLCGIVSIGDIVKAHHDQLEQDNNFMRSYIQGEGGEVATPDRAH